jgi:membrane protein DedA with SNARE-associated domain/rhodanese-related sulfurtransferase
MNETLEFLVHHGAAVLFAAVFIEQMGVPLPAMPWLLAAGALAGTGKMSGVVALSAATFGSVVADLIWFYLGRRYGNRVLKLLCRISIEPDSCVRRTQNVFTRYGMKGLVVAKFFPGLSTLAPPLAASAGVSFPRFFLFDAAGSLIYAGTFIVLGIVFSRQLEQVIDSLGSLGGGALTLLAALAVLYIGYKYFQRHRLLRQLRTSRITADELHEKLEAGEKLIILDLRPLEELEQNPALILGALHMTLEEVEHRDHEIPRDRDIILYCSCPNEVSSARVALLLHRRGIARVRPLLGGIDAWRERNYPMEPLPVHQEQILRAGI